MVRTRVSAARLERAQAARESVAALKQIRERLLKAGEKYWAQQVEIQELEVEAWTALAEEKKRNRFSG